MTMTRNRTLFFFLTVFVVISLLLVWSQVYDGKTRFLAGTKPFRPPAPIILPQLPPLRPFDSIRGGTGSDVITVVEFADFTCPGCRAVEPEVIKLLQELGPRVRLVWRNLPLGQESPSTIVTILAAQCAKDQGKFWEMHDELLKTQQLDLDRMTKLASKIGLNSSTFTACLSSPDQLTRIQDDIRIAEQYHLKSAPVFFIGREVMAGYVTSKQLKASVERAVFKK